MFTLAEFSSDASWQYTFIIVMVVILIGSGIYTYVLAHLKKKKEAKETIKNDINDEYTKAVFDNEEIMLKKKD